MSKITACNYISLVAYKRSKRRIEERAVMLLQGGLYSQEER